MKGYEFRIQLIGFGDTAKEAWEDVCEHLNFGSAEEYEMPQEDDYEIIDDGDSEETS